MVLSPMKESYVELYKQVRGDWSVLEVMLEPRYEGWQELSSQREEGKHR